METNFQELDVITVGLSMDERPLEQGGGYINYIEVLVSGAADRELAREKLAEEMGISEDRVTVRISEQ
jgi:hypothetical protein